MKNNLKWIFGIVVFVILITGAYVAYNALKDEYTPDKIATEKVEKEEPKNYEAPDFTVIDNDGNEVSLSEMKGKPCVVNFWASWCPPCKAELPDFDEMFKKYSGEVAFMMVNMTDGQRETLEIAKAYINESGYEFPVYFDTEYSAAIAYGVSSLPMTIFVDKEGNLVTYANGMIDAGTLEKGISMIR